MQSDESTSITAPTHTGGSVSAVTGAAGQREGGGGKS